MGLRLIALLSGFAAVLLWPVFALAASGSGSGYLNEIILAILSILGAWLGGLIIKFVTNLAKKSGIELDAAKQILLENAVRKAILWAEEKAMNQFKLDGLERKGEEKLADAISAVRKNKMFKNIDDAELDELIHSAINIMRSTGQLVGKSIRAASN